MPRLTDKFARETTTERQQKRFADSGEGALRGLGLRMTAAGAKSWIFSYVTRTGTERRMTIGSFPAWSAKQARDRAAELRREVDTGGDPLTQARGLREAPDFQALVDRYIEEHLPRKAPSSAREDLYLIKTLRDVDPGLPKHKLRDLRRADIEKIHRKITERGTPVHADRVLSLLSMMFNLAERWDLLPTGCNPCKGVRRNGTQARARYLNRDEIGRLVEALAEYRRQNPSSADAIELLLLTGSRRGEVLGARWAEFDLDNAVWVKPATNTKQRREHRVPISLEAIELLRRRLPTRDGRLVSLNPSDFVFPGGGAKRHQTEVRRAWLKVCEAAGLRDVRLHDLRHSYASLLVSAGRSLPEIGALLGHRQVATTARYSHLFDEPLRAATEHVGKVIRGARK